MAFPGDTYAPPGVYTDTEFENPVAGALAGLKIPVFIGEGNEFLVQKDLEVTRGSSASVDQRVVHEDETGRAVVSIAVSGQVTFGQFDGAITRFQVRNFPIVRGDGNGTTTTQRSDVSVTIDGDPIVVDTVDGANGIIGLAQPPNEGQLVRCTYFFNRTDTRFTDDVSGQVDDDTAFVQALTGIGDADAQAPTAPVTVLDLHEDILNAEGIVVVPANNVLVLIVDGEEFTLALPPRTDYTMAQVATTIASFVSATLTATTFLNNFGLSTLQLTADHSLIVGSGSANAILGLQAGQANSRVKTFFTFQGPIVDGTNGGVTTTDPSNVTVKVDGVQVIPTSVDGASRAVTLPVAPIAGATVTLAYWANTWQDTFDFLANIGIVRIDRVGEIPNASTFIEDADFVLKNDLIVWGTASLVSAGITTAGATPFGENQVTSTLIDNKTFLAVATPVLLSSGGSSTVSSTQFELPLQPTLGNGRDTKLGQSLFQDVSNTRIDVPVNRPDVVNAYWGYDVQDALTRGEVEVTKVEGIVITLKAPVPVGAIVFATFFYNRLTDNEYTLTTIIPGPSGTGTYQIAGPSDTLVFNPSFNTGSKGIALSGISLEFPSGSEFQSDVRFEPPSDIALFRGSVQEIVTVEFASRAASPARYTVPGAGPYAFIDGESDKLRLSIDANTTVQFGAPAGGDLSDPSTHGEGFFASLVGEEIVYTGGTGATVGVSYELTTDEAVNLLVDGVQVATTVPADAGVPHDILYFADFINEAVSGHGSTAAVNEVGTSLLTLDPAFAHPSDDYYNGWILVIGTAFAIDNAQAQVVTDYVGSTGIITVGAAWTGGDTFVDIADTYFLYNPDTQAAFKGATLINGPVAIASGGFDELSFAYVGDVSGASGTITVPTAGALTAGSPYATAAALAITLETEMNAEAVIAGVAGVAGTHPGLEFFVEADADGRLVFKFQLSGDDTAGYMTFIDAPTGIAADIAILLGLDTGAAVDSGQMHLVQGPVARANELTVAGFKPYDRLILRNRILPGWTGSMDPSNAVAQMQLEVQAGSGNEKAGLVVGSAGVGAATATVDPASIVGRVGFAGGQDGTNSEPEVTFFDGTGTTAANDTFDFDLDGIPIPVTFTSTPTGTVTELGPATGTGNGSVLDQIIDAIAALPGAPFGNAAAVFAAGLVRQEGTGIRITSTLSTVSSAIVIGSGGGNSVLGFTDGAVVQRTLVDPQVLASGLMSNRVASFASYVHTFPDVDSGTFAPVGGVTTDYFAETSLATVALDLSGNEYLFVQSLSTGAASTLQFLSATVAGVRTDDALFPGTLINVPVGEGDTGETPLDGFFVSSNNGAGSGSADDSVLNNGTGSDGVVGQTYRDAVTGLTFTILPRGFLNNETGPWLSYPAGGTSTFRFDVTNTFVTDANLPHNALNGVELLVSNTSGVAEGDTAIVETFNKGGREPSNGDIYYITYTYQKLEFSTRFFTKMSAIEQQYGTVSPDNPVSLASFLAITNGAIVVGIKQVEREEGLAFASLESYVAAIEELEGVLPANAKPDIITPLRGDSTELYLLLRRSNAIQSSIRYKSERTSVIGMSAGSLPQDAIDLAKTLSDTRMRLVYPDIGTVSIQDAIGNIVEHLIDGPMFAAGLIGSIVSANTDVATPWTGRLLVNYTSLARRLDAVEQNQVAQNGVTILEERPPFLRVRHGLTTNMENILTKTPTIIMIADEVQRQSRVVLESFVGIKFLPGILSQVEGKLSMLLNALVRQQIITAYTGVSAQVAPDDPTVAEVQAFYQPVFPLLFLILTFHLRANL